MVEAESPGASGPKSAASAAQKSPVEMRRSTALQIKPGQEARSSIDLARLR